MRGAQRVEALPEYLSARLTRLVGEARAQGHDVISLGIGDPDSVPPHAIREALFDAARRDDVHGYPTNAGLPVLRQRVATYYADRFGVGLDPETQVMPLLGAKEGLAHLCMAQLDPGDRALIADPGYPVYTGGTIAAGGIPVGMPLRAEGRFLPDLDAITAADRDRANLLICGYPNNPTGAVANLEFFASLSAFGHSHDIPICHDNAYAELTFDGLRSESFLAAPDALDAGIEIYSLSKSLSLPGWRMAFAVGNAEMLSRLRRFKTHIDSGMWMALQHAAVTAFDLLPEETARLRAVYEQRRDLVCDALSAAGVAVIRPQGSLYVWMPVPKGEQSLPFAERLFRDAHVVVGPGIAYGSSSDDHVRLALTVPDDRLAEAVARITRAL